MVAHPGELPLGLYRGDSYEFTVRIWADSAHTIPGDLTGTSAAAEVRKGADVMAFTCTVTDPNLIDVELPAAAWGTIGPGMARWDLQLTWPDGRVYTVLAGPVTIVGDVTV